MARIGDLFNKPTGSEAQISATSGAKDLIITGEAVLTILTPIAIGLLPPELAATIIKVWVAQLGVAYLGILCLDHRLDKLRK